MPFYVHSLSHACIHSFIQQAFVDELNVFYGAITWPGLREMRMKKTESLPNEDYAQFSELSAMCSLPLLLAALFAIKIPLWLP